MTREQFQALKNGDRVKYTYPGDPGTGTVSRNKGEYADLLEIVWDDQARTILDTSGEVETKWAEDLQLLKGE